MNASQEKALFHLTGISNLSQVKESSLQQLAAEYPYFAPIHLFLAEKWRETDETKFANESQKANLYFTNPYWLHFQLSNQGNGSEASDPSISLETIIHQSNQPNYTGLTKEKTQELAEPQQEAPILEDPLLATALEETSTAVPETAPTSPSISNDFSIPTIEMVKEMMRGIDHQPQIEHTDLIPEIEASSPIEASTPIVTVDPIIDAWADTKEEAAALAPLADEIPEPIAPASEAYNEAEATDMSNAKISSLLSGQLAEFKKPVTEADQLGLPKDPMHTIDYFASQGIKIDLSQIPQDKLTTHLRRFTDWLKYMKSENPNPVDLGTRKDLEEAVAQIAQSSNESKEVLTESMADVLQKQGQIDKAIQLYIKLSFLNPEKSAYFAAKIQHLKGIQ